MKLQCDLCKEIVPAEFTVAGNAIEVACPACKGTFTVSARGEAPVVDLSARARAARRPPADGEPAMTCPKCGDVQPTAAACRSCGLLADKMPEFQRDRDTKVPSEVLAAWDEVTAKWSDEDAHDRFARTASTALSYTWAAQRYRDALRLRPDDLVAAAQLARLAKMAEATLLASASRKPQAGAKAYKKATMMIVGLIAFAILGVVYAIVVSRSAGDGRETLRKPPTKPAKKAPRAPHSVDAGPRGP